jgi:hypothetical protein
MLGTKLDWLRHLVLRRPYHARRLNGHVYGCEGCRFCTYCFQKIKSVYGGHVWIWGLSNQYLFVNLQDKYMYSQNPLCSDWYTIRLRAEDVNACLLDGECYVPCTYNITWNNFYFLLISIILLSVIVDVPIT